MKILIKVIYEAYEVIFLVLLDTQGYIVQRKYKVFCKLGAVEAVFHGNI